MSPLLTLNLPFTCMKFNCFGYHSRSFYWSVAGKCYMYYFMKWSTCCIDNVEPTKFLFIQVLYFMAVKNFTSVIKRSGLLSIQQRQLLQSNKKRVVLYIVVFFICWLPGRPFNSFSFLCLTGRWRSCSLGSLILFLI